jgi:hypothetical protein
VPRSTSRLRRAKISVHTYIIREHIIKRPSLRERWSMSWLRRAKILEVEVEEEREGREGKGGGREREPKRERERARAREREVTLKTVR